MENFYEQIDDYRVANHRRYGDHVKNAAAPELDVRKYSLKRENDDVGNGVEKIDNRRQGIRGKEPEQNPEAEEEFEKSENVPYELYDRLFRESR